MTQTQSVPSVTDDGFAADVLESELPVLVDFTASGCSPCRVMEPVLAELAAERDDLRLVRLDVDEHERTAAEHVLRFDWAGVARQTRGHEELLATRGA